jgi:hypothetical protein
MKNHIRIEDHAIWFKHLPSRDIRDRLSALEPEAEVTVEVDGVTGKWQRMKRGVDGRLTDAIRPVGEMKAVWNDWFRNRKGDKVTLRVLTTADDFLAGLTPVFSEWTSTEDEEAFRDL